MMGVCGSSTNTRKRQSIRVPTRTLERFSEGETLRGLVCAMADWITGKRKDFPVNDFGPWPDYVRGGDLWGYGVDMATVKKKSGS